MEPWQRRVVNEKAELDGKIKRLNAFINDTSKFNDLAVETRVLLTKQEEVMIQYSDILGQRIAQFS